MQMKPALLIEAHERAVERRDVTMSNVYRTALLYRIRQEDKTYKNSSPVEYSGTSTEIHPLEASIKRQLKSEIRLRSYLAGQLASALAYCIFVRKRGEFFGQSDLFADQYIGEKRRAIAFVSFVSGIIKNSLEKELKPPDKDLEIFGLIEKIGWIPNHSTQWSSQDSTRKETTNLTGQGSRLKQEPPSRQSRKEEEKKLPSGSKLF